MEKVMLVLVSSDEKAGVRAATGNNNKFYYLELDDNGIFIQRYGRIGTSGVTLTKPNSSKRDFDKKLKDKIKGGYVVADIDLETKDDKINITNDSKLDIMDLALEQIKHDDVSKELIKKLVNANIHNITSNTKITFNLKTGIFKTPLGIVTKSGVLKAKDILQELLAYVDEHGLKNSKDEDKVRSLSEQYYTIIPTIISNLRPLSSHLVNTKKIEFQNDICDTLIQSLDLIELEKEKAKSSTSNQPKEKIFDTSLTLLTDKKEFDRIVNYFETSKNKNHGHRTSNAKIKRIFNLNIDKDDKAFRSDMTNIQSLFHGTRLCNILSIIKNSLLLPKQSPGQVTGYMFGQGLYFGNQSSKSLGYVDSMYWAGGKKTSDNLVYMFLADVALGNYQIPKGPTSKNPDKGFDSYWAKSGQSGVMNDEIIIFNNNQIKLTHLLEIELN